MVKILAYGTLREGDYNFDRMASAFGVDSIKKVGETELSGYKMHDLGFYPAIKEGTETDKIKCDILEVNEQTARAIDYMESGAGYKTVETDLGKIYVFEGNLSNRPIITSGDWFNK
jgi:gamma-glutamylcyclotransferase (GGCT)/AIG2-like uncharacterized protein YtfP